MDGRTYGRTDVRTDVRTGGRTFSPSILLGRLSEVDLKIANFTTFLFPLGDAPGAITLNVVWMEREFDAYKLSRCICPSNYNRFWDRARYWSKIVIFSYPRAFDAPVRGSRRNSATPFGIEKLEWLGYPMVKKFRRYLYLFCIEKLEWLGYRW